MYWLFVLWLYFDIDDVGTHFIFPFGYPASLEYTTLRRTLYNNLVLINNTISLHLLILILVITIVLVFTSLIPTGLLALTTPYNILGSPRIVVVPTLYLINSLIIIVLSVVIVVVF